MTLEEVREKYGRGENGYVWCHDCPLDAAHGECPFTNSCDGYGKAYDHILEFLDKEQTESVETESVEKVDLVNFPPHYTQGGIECIQAMEAAYGKKAVAHFCICNAFKYLWRTEHKNGIQDIDKAIWYLNKYKELKSSE